MLSQYDCGQKGYAQIDDFVHSVNTVFLQTIEHLDGDGCTGNLADVLAVMLAGDTWKAYEKGTLNCQHTGLISNYPLTALMIPPEHRGRMEPILENLRQIKR